MDNSTTGPFFVGDVRLEGQAGNIDNNGTVIPSLLRGAHTAVSSPHSIAIRTGPHHGKLLAGVNLDIHKSHAVFCRHLLIIFALISRVVVDGGNNTVEVGDRTDHGGQARLISFSQGAVPVKDFVQLTRQVDAGNAILGKAKGLSEPVADDVLNTVPGVRIVVTRNVGAQFISVRSQGSNLDKYDLLVSLRNVKSFALDNPILVSILFTVVLIALLYWFFGTEVGSGIRATGANPNMSRAQGINVDRNKVLGLMISNGIVALASALYAQYQGFTDVNAGRGAIVIGLAAVIIGEVIFSRIFRNFALKLLSVALGAVIYYVVIQVVLTLGLESNDLKLFSALVVAVFLAVPYWKNKWFRGRVKAAGKKEELPHA